jgi:hypothetical protein
MKLTDDQNKIELDGKKAVFVPSTSAYQCESCCFRSCCVPHIPCLPNERLDGKSGFYELEDTP